MAGFDDRKNTFEKKFAHDEATKFKINARRNRLLGLWAAKQMGLDGESAEAYAKLVVRADFDEPGEEDVFRKVWRDLQEKKVDVSEHRVRRQMAELLDTARDQVTSE